MNLLIELLTAGRCVTDRRKRYFVENPKTGCPEQERQQQDKKPTARFWAWTEFFSKVQVSNGRSSQGKLQYVLRGVLEA